MGHVGGKLDTVVLLDKSRNSMTRYPYIEQNIACFLGCVLLTWGHLHELGEVVNHHKNASVSIFRSTNFLVVNLDDFVEAAAFYILQGEPFSSRRTLRVLEQTTSRYPFLDGTVQAGSDEVLFDPGDDFVHALMTLVIWRAEDHLGMEQLGQEYCAVIINLLFRFSCATEDSRRVHKYFAFPLLVEVVHDLSDFWVQEIFIISLFFALPRGAFKIVLPRAPSQSKHHDNSPLSPLEVGH